MVALIVGILLVAFCVFACLPQGLAWGVELEEKFADGETVNRESLRAKGLVGKVIDGVKILGNGDLKKKLNVEVEKVSASAKAKIEAAGGTVKVLVPAAETKTSEEAK